MNSNIDEILTNLDIKYSYWAKCDTAYMQGYVAEAKQAIQQELLKARIDEISILRNGYGWGDALETSEYILDDRIADLQAKLKENSDG